MKKAILIAILLSLVLISLGCVQKVEPTKEIRGGTRNFLGCGNPTGDLEKKACNLIAANPKLKECEIRDNVEEVFFCIAIITKDPKICENIKRSKYYLCKAYTDNNPSMCDEIKVDLEIDKCYTDLGMNLKSGDLCNKIKNETKKSACFGVVNLDLEKCFDDKESERMCILNVLEFSGGKVSCNELVDEKREECLRISGGE